MSAVLSESPLVSVVMPVYNRAQFVAEAMDSILAQTYKHLELIVVDDGSTDETPRIVREFAERDARIHPLFLEHAGVSPAMNAGIMRARGEFIARMDSDDIALPQRLEVQLNWMRKNAVDVCGSSVMRFGDARGPIWFPESHEAIRRELLFRVGILFPTTIARAEILHSNPCNEDAQFDDYELCIRLAPRFQMGNVPQLLLKHRCHVRQSHIISGKAFRNEVRLYRRRCFGDLFPHAAPEEWARFERIAEHKGFDTLLELRHAGEWLAKLAQIPDGFLHQKTASRWRGVCRASAALGPSSYRVYLEWLPRIYPAAPRDDRALQIACALHLKPQSHIGRIVDRAARWSR